MNNNGDGRPPLPPGNGFLPVEPGCLTAILWLVVFWATVAYIIWRLV